MCQVAATPHVLFLRHATCHQTVCSCLKGGAGLSSMPTGAENVRQQHGPRVIVKLFEKLGIIL